MESKNEELAKEAFRLVETKAGTPFEKSRTAFISCNQVTGSITLSSFLARAMGLVSGDRVGLIESNDNKLKFLLVKTRQRQNTKEVRIGRGLCKVNSRPWVTKFANAFRFNTEFKQLIRLYVNMDCPITIPAMDNAKALQLYDMPLLREDFASEEEKQEYCDYIDAHPYIIKKIE